MTTGWIFPSVLGPDLFYALWVFCLIDFPYKSKPLLKIGATLISHLKASGKKFQLKAGESFSGDSKVITPS